MPARQKEKVVFDFSEVHVVSSSFADECFAKLLLEFDLPYIKEHTTFRHTNDFVRSVITRAFEDQILALEEA